MAETNYKKINFSAAQVNNKLQRDGGQDDEIKALQEGLNKMGADLQEKAGAKETEKALSDQNTRLNDLGLKVGEVNIGTPNLFVGYVRGTTGELVTSSTVNKYTDKINVEGIASVRFEGVQYESKSTVYAGYAFYNSSNVYISGAVYDKVGIEIIKKEYNITVPDGAAYMRITVRNEFVDTFYCYLLPSNSLEAKKADKETLDNYIAENDTSVLEISQAIKPQESIVPIKVGSSHSSGSHQVKLSVAEGTTMRVTIKSLGGYWNSTTPLYKFYKDGTNAQQTVYCNRVYTMIAEKDIKAIGLYIAPTKATVSGDILLSVGVEENAMDVLRYPTSIFDHFPQYEYNPKVATLSKNSKSLHLLWFSDIHGDTTNMSRINEWSKEYSTYIDDVLNGGDMVYQNYTTNYEGQMIPYFEQYGGDKHLLCLGNHDVANSGIYAWTTLPISEIYTKYMSPMDDDALGVIRPMGDKCYYYKDYTEKSIRLVVLDTMITDASYVSEQLTWFENVLSSAKNSGFAVVAISHYTPHSYISLQNGKGFTSFENYTNAGNDEIDNRFLTLVDNFIESGGEFVTWLVGHVHCDIIGSITNHPKQLVVGVTTASQDRGDVAPINPSRIRNTKTNDAFNHISVNKSTGLITLLRIGYDFDSRGREIKMISIDYKAQKVIV